MVWGAIGRSDNLCFYYHVLDRVNIIGTYRNGSVDKTLGIVLFSLYHCFDDGTIVV